MKKIFVILALSLLAFCMSACETSKKKTLPSREVEGGELPWSRPASWEGGLPGMGGVGTPMRY